MTGVFSAIQWEPNGDGQLARLNPFHPQSYPQVLWITMKLLWQ